MKRNDFGRVTFERQRILIRGWNASKPVLFFLHGGPGMPAMYLAHDCQQELEKDFVVVHWDRRGAGKSYASGVEGKRTVRQTLDDTYELTRLLQKRFGQKRMYLVGHSWGSYIGMLAVWDTRNIMQRTSGWDKWRCAWAESPKCKRSFCCKKPVTRATQSS